MNCEGRSNAPPFSFFAISDKNWHKATAANPTIGFDSMTKKTDSLDSGVKTLQHGLDILTCFLTNTGELSLTELAHIMGRNAASTYRLVSTLEKTNFLKKNPVNKKYSLGITLKLLGDKADYPEELVALVQPHLAAINKIFNENSSLYVLQNYRRLCVARIESTHSLRQVLAVGSSLPLTRGAGGKVLLAYQPEKTRKTALKTDPVITEVELAAIRAAGYAISSNESTQGTTGIGVPIFNADGSIAGVLNLSGPMARMSPDIVTKGVNVLMEHAKEISEQLGYGTR